MEYLAREMSCRLPWMAEEEEEGQGEERRKEEKPPCETAHHRREYQNLSGFLHSAGETEAQQATGCLPPCSYFR